MSTPLDPIRDKLRELDRAFVAFERGQRNRLYESRDAMLGLAESVESSDWSALGPLCDIANRILGVLLMENGLDEQRAVGFVRELLGYVEAQITESAGDSAPGGVFHLVNAEKVGDMLVRKGIIGPEQLQKALLLQRVSKGRRVGQVLIAMNAIDQRTLDTVLADQRDETRRAETRRVGNAGHGGSPSLRLDAGHRAPLPAPQPLPPIPGSAPLPPLPPGPPVDGAPTNPPTAPLPAPPPVRGDGAPSAPIPPPPGPPSGT